MLKGFRVRLLSGIILMALLSIVLSRFYQLGSININAYDTYFEVSYSAIIFSFLFILYLIVETLFYRK